uniref:Uncharacterized protein n=1 Tax=Anguilla anguilla TaxID=7936 RepID=A0A0E9XN81_ANGAN
MHKMKTCTHTESGTALAMDKRVKVNTVDSFAPNFFYRFVGIFILKEHKEQGIFSLRFTTLPLW